MKTLATTKKLNSETIFKVFKYTFISTIIIFGALICIHAIKNPHLISM